MHSTYFLIFISTRHIYKWFLPLALLLLGVQLALGQNSPFPTLHPHGYLFSAKKISSSQDVADGIALNSFDFHLDFNDRGSYLCERSSTDPQKRLRFSNLFQDSKRLCVRGTRIGSFIISSDLNTFDEVREDNERFYNTGTSITRRLFKSFFDSNGNPIYAFRGRIRTSFNGNAFGRSRFPDGLAFNAKKVGDYEYYDVLAAGNRVVVAGGDRLPGNLIVIRIKAVVHPSVDSYYVKLEVCKGLSDEVHLDANGQIIPKDPTMAERYSLPQSAYLKNGKLINITDKQFNLLGDVPPSELIDGTPADIHVSANGKREIRSTKTPNGRYFPPGVQYANSRSNASGYFACDFVSLNRANVEERLLLNLNEATPSPSAWTGNDKIATNKFNIEFRESHKIVIRLDSGEVKRCSFIDAGPNKRGQIVAKVFEPGLSNTWTCYLIAPIGGAPSPNPRFEQMLQEAGDLDALADRLERSDQEYHDAVVDMLFEGYESPYATVALDLPRQDIPAYFADKTAIAAVRSQIVERIRTKAKNRRRFAEMGLGNEPVASGVYAQSTIDLFASLDSSKYNKEFWDALWMAGYVDYDLYTQVENELIAFGQKDYFEKLVLAASVVTGVGDIATLSRFVYTVGLKKLFVTRVEQTGIKALATKVLPRTLEELPSPELTEEIAANFRGGIYVNTLTASTRTLYRYSLRSNVNTKKIVWLTDKLYSSEEEMRKALAIDSDWGDIDSVSTIVVPAGTWISEGTVAALKHAPDKYPGGGYQAAIQNVADSWIVKTGPAWK